MTLVSSNDWISVTKKKHKTTRNTDNDIEENCRNTSRSDSSSSYRSQAPVQKPLFSEKSKLGKDVQVSSFGGKPQLKKPQSLKNAIDTKVVPRLSRNYSNNDIADVNEFPFLARGTHGRFNELGNKDISQISKDTPIVSRPKVDHTNRNNGGNSSLDTLHHNVTKKTKKKPKKKKPISQEIENKQEIMPPSQVNLCFDENEFPSLGNHSISAEKISTSNQVNTYDHSIPEILDNSLNFKEEKNVKLRGVIRTNGSHLTKKSDVKKSTDNVRVVNLADLLDNASINKKKEASDLTPKKKETSDLSLKKTVSSNKNILSANTLDSNAPVKIGKKREEPKARRNTKLKKVILKDREFRKNANETISSLPNEQNLESEKEYDEKSIPVIDKEVHDNNNFCTQSYVKNVVHSRRFREFCFQMLNEEIDNSCTELLQELVKFQDRAYHKDPTKAKLKRRIVLGLRELTKHLQLNHIKCVIVAPNLERCKSSGGLDDSVHLIIDVCREKDIPCIFALDRRKLGKICKKPVPASAVGIFSYDGANEIYKDLLRLSEQAREAYSLMLKVVAADMNHIRDNEMTDSSIDLISGKMLPNETDKQQTNVDNSKDMLFSRYHAILDDDIKLLEFEDENKPMKSSHSEHIGDNKKAISSPIEGITGSPYPELDNFIYCVVSARQPPGYIRKWTYFSMGEIMVYDVAQNRYCERIGRNHQSNNIMILADLRRKVYYQKCYDPECKAAGYKSPEYSLPDEALPYHIIFATEDNDFNIDGQSYEHLNEGIPFDINHQITANSSDIEKSKDSIKDNLSPQITESELVSDVDELEDQDLLDVLEDQELLAAVNITSEVSGHISTWF